MIILSSHPLHTSWVYRVNCAALCKQIGVSHNLHSAIPVRCLPQEPLPEGTSQRHVRFVLWTTKARRCLKSPRQKRSPKGTERQNSLADQSVIGHENNAPPPLWALSETPNTSRVPSLFSPRRWEPTVSFAIPPAYPQRLHARHYKRDSSSAHTSFAWLETYLGHPKRGSS